MSIRSVAWARQASFCSLILLSGATTAADIRVTKTSDSLDGTCNADCSLREAVVLANNLSGKQRIVLPAGVYTLTLPPERGDPDEDEEDVRLDEDNNLNGDLDIKDDLEIVGAGSANTVIDGTQNDRILEVFPEVIFNARQLTLRNGYSSFYGGAIANAGQTTLRYTRLEHNRYYHPWGGGRQQGGAIANYGALYLYNTQFEHNQASGGDSNAGYGGAIHNSAAGYLLARETLFRDNRAFNDDDSSGDGGALDNLGYANIARSAFIDNYAGYGGAVINKGSGWLKLANSSFSGNRSAYDSWNGILQNGKQLDESSYPFLLLIHVSIAGNHNYGLTSYRGTVHIRNSLISGNYQSYHQADANCFSHYSATRGLLLGNGVGNCTGERYVENAKTFTQVLFPLADNGGATPTFALRPGSPALDASIDACASHDQRRALRPQDGDGDGIAVCDLGAYERAAP